MLPAFHKEKHGQSLSVWHWLKLNLFVEILCFTSHRCSVGYLVYNASLIGVFHNGFKSLKSSFHPVCFCQSQFSPL